jgi:hypothetical protein
MLDLRLVVGGLLVAVLAGCSAPSSMDEAVGRVPAELMAPRPKYDVSRPFEQLVRPHFFARSNQGELEEVQGIPDLIVEWQGKVKVRLKQAQQPQYLDLLALESELLGEHPSHKILRLRAMGIPIADDLERKLRSSSSAHRLFHTLDFEYLPGKETTGVIAEVFPDGTFLVIPFGVPTEWQSDKEANRLDIQSGTRVRYTPVGTDTFRVELALGQSLDVILGPALPLNDGGGAPPDDGFSQVALTTAFPFLGVKYDAIFVGSDGHITLGAADGSSSTRDAARHTGGPPRLSVLLTDLDPACAGTVHADVRSDRVVVTWNQVVYLERGSADGCGPNVPTNTMQAILYSDGTVDYIYGELDTDLFSQAGGNREAVIGIAEGNAEGPLNKIDMTRDLPVRLQAGAIFEEYRPGPPQTDKVAIASPTHFHVNPRALSAGDSSLAREYEKEILGLPFDEQRYPSARLARQECGVYKESLQSKEYQSILASVGYRFTPAHVLKRAEGQPPVFGESLSALLWEGSGKGVQYFGFDRYWAAERLASLQASWIGECDAAGGVRRYRLKERPNDNFYITVRRSLEHDKKDRHKIVSLGDDGSGRVIYDAPGIMLMARPLPWDDSYWLISTEGWTEAKKGEAADPRWQSVYVVNVRDPQDYHILAYPLDRYPKPPKGGHLYGSSAILSADGRSLFNILYGFKDEGGGVWVADLSEKEFYTKPASFARIVAWDHALSWTVLEDKSDGPAPFMHVFMTGKEVADDFAMTANLLRIKNAGLDSAIQHQERLLQMVGWNPVPFALQRISEHEFRVGVETYFNYESSLLPRAEGVYLISVDTTRNQ